MPQAVDTITAALEQLTEQLQSLERRVATLERHAEKPPAPDLVSAQETGLQRPRAPETWRGFPPVETPSGAVTVIGKAVLGIAGAYLLRAVAESGSVPKLPVLLVAIVYACLWMVWAVRVHISSRFAGVAYSITSALILSPMLWESTVRFQVLSPAFAALVLVGTLLLVQGHRAAKYLFAAAALFLAAMTFRTIDLEVCTWAVRGGRGVGTHFLWHTLNGLVLYVLMLAAIRHGGRKDDGSIAPAARSAP